MSKNQENTKINIYISKIKIFFSKYYGIGILVLSHTLLSTVNACVKMLYQNSVRSWNAFQIILIRMVPTYILAIIYYKCAETMEKGASNINTRIFLFLRGFFGFIGIYCTYYSIHHLDLSDATALSFLNPIFINLLGHPILYQTFNFFDIYAALVSFIGVMFIVKPSFILNNHFFHALHDNYSTSEIISSANSKERVLAIMISLIGVLAVCFSYIIIKKLGDSINSLQPILWYSLISSIGSILFLISFNSPFNLPLNFLEVFLFFVIGISGFFAQVFLTRGLQIEKIGRASSVIYLQIIFSLFYDRVLWGKFPDIWSFCGIVLILIGTAMTIIGRNKENENPDNKSRYISLHQLKSDELLEDI
ncbi:hypothetical protein T552_01962 [Pneumocystis carinii B80]|uniref:EamA domain-containing protein n=1 Tax=Pneumocystis carinii (strain B80) TaxID=1408658 RepID=A0A0W4ZIC0_PNEC8|nr:hypothetical protein T552_01962 [Pneumocystis carinii B80]KTW28101.1 hypothetical protein T552_01962 [Pneumocystis carinii B80]